MLVEHPRCPGYMAQDAKGTELVHTGWEHSQGQKCHPRVRQRVAHRGGSGKAWGKNV